MIKKRNIILISQIEILSEFLINYSELLSIKFLYKSFHKNCMYNCLYKNTQVI